MVGVQTFLSLSFFTPSPERGYKSAPVLAPLSGVGGQTFLFGRLKLVKQNYLIPNPKSTNRKIFLHITVK
jgi:hypothetical protein